MCEQTHGQTRVIESRPSGNLNYFYGEFLPGFFWPIILICLVCSPYLVYLGPPPMCVHTFLSQDGFHRKGIWVEHPLASFPFGLQGAFLRMCGQGSLLTSRMRNMWSGRALPPHLIVLLLSSWIFSPQGMNLQSLYPVGSWGSIYLLPHLEDVNHKNKKQTKKPSSSIS